VILSLDIYTVRDLFYSVTYRVLAAKL